MERTKPSRRRACGWGLLALLAGTVACTLATPIGNILSKPADYMGKDVTVAGEVTGSFKLPLVPAVYTIRDETGEIPVVSDGQLPSTGARVRIRARVESAISFGVRSFGVHLKESAGTSR